MKFKQIIILSVIFILLLVGVAVRKFQKPVELSAELYAPLNLSFDRDAVTEIELVKGKETSAVKIIRENGMWKIPGLWSAHADFEKVNKFLDEIRQAKGEVRAKDKNLFGDFGITDEEAYRIVLKDQTQNVLLTVLLGQKKPSFESAVFLRLPGLEAVYWVSTDIFALIGIGGDPALGQLKNEFWANVKIAPLAIDQIKQIEIERFFEGKGNVVLSLLRDSADTENPWKFTRENVPGRPDQEKIKGFLSNLKLWKALKVLNPEAQDYGFEKTDWQMKLTSVSGENTMITRGAKEADTQDYFVKVSTEPVVFKASHYYFETMDRDDKYFLTETKPDESSKPV
ncbi:MAG: DUF4340 domain-containing protein [Candidatus Omnitrophica bacterium]|nr:DUF4340 domain-containing protein [Candidatus Omnitrophota bacterium]